MSSSIDEMSDGSTRFMSKLTTKTELYPEAITGNNGRYHFIVFISLFEIN